MKAKRLRAGDTIGIASPSWGGPAVFPHRLDNSIGYLESRGFCVRVAPHARGQEGFVSGTAAERTADLHDLFGDPDVTAIIASVGGDHSCHLLPHLDFELIAQNPKVFMGYSDITVLNIAIWQRTGLVTFNGPAMMTDFAEYPTPFDYTIRYFDRAVCSGAAMGRIEPATQWTEELLDWGIKADLRGTSYWPDFEGRILFLETSEEKPSPARVDGILMDYENMGVLGQISGLLVGRPMYYSDSEKAALREIVYRRTADYSFPIVTDMDFGHTAPQFTLPVGCAGRLDSESRTFEVVEPAVV